MSECKGDKGKACKGRNWLGEGIFSCGHWDPVESCCELEEKE